MNTDQKLRWAATAFGLLGLGVSIYLTILKLFPLTPFCLGVGDCESVNASVYSQIMGIPIALLGVLAYAALLLLLGLESRIPLLKAWGSTAQVSIAFAGTLYSAYLTYIEVAVLRKICPYCVTSAIAITLLFLISAWRVRLTFQAEA